MSKDYSDWGNRFVDIEVRHKHDEASGISLWVAWVPDEEGRISGNPEPVLSDALTSVLAAIMDFAMRIDMSDHDE